MAVELATLGGGCFWCLEAALEQLSGVVRVESGFAGGADDKATYQQVCAGNTGHAEVVQVSFDSDVISYRELLDVFFAIHDPTTLNRQGADVGTQYRSVIFYHSAEQRSSAAAAIEDLSRNGIWTNPIVTELTPYSRFHKAESYHQGYFRANPSAGYCQAVILPKLGKFRKQFLAKLKA